MTDLIYASFSFLFARFKDIFQEVYESKWKTKFEEAGIWWVLDLASFHNAYVCIFAMRFVEIIFMSAFLGMSIVSLMIWLLMLSRVMEVMCGHARTMMGMYRVISLPKVCVGHLSLAFNCDIIHEHFEDAFTEV